MRSRVFFYLNKMIFVFVLIVFGNEVHAYPSFIGLGYQACISCHYNPLGNGALTDYGRSVSALEIADRLIWAPKVSDDTIAEKSGFLGQENIAGVEWLRPSFGYRGIYLMQDAGGDNSENEYFTMDAHVSMVGKFLEDDRLIVAAQMAYAPKPRASSENIETYRSREHYVGYRWTKEFGTYAGLMDKAFGLRIPDHIAFSRTLTRNAQNDQTHGVLAHFVNSQFELAGHAFIGNLAQDSDLRQKGIAAVAEYSFGKYIRVGGSALTSASDYVSLNMLAAQAKIGIPHGHAILAEAGIIDRTVDATGDERKSQYLFTQSYYYLRRGLWLLLTAEGMQADTTLGGHTRRIGPGVQFFPFQRLELRADALHTTTVSAEGDSDSRLDMMLQTHLWL